MYDIEYFDMGPLYSVVSYCNHYLSPELMEFTTFKLKAVPCDCSETD